MWKHRLGIKIQVILGMLIIGIGAIPCGATSENWQQHYQAAERLIASGDYKEAETEARKALAESEPLGINDQRYVTSLERLGNILVHTKKIDEAEQSLRKAVEIRKKSGKNWLALDLAQTLVQLGFVCDQEGKVSEARNSYEGALEIQRSLLPANDPLISSVQFHLAMLEAKAGNAHQALAIARRALADIPPGDAIPNIGLDLALSIAAKQRMNRQSDYLGAQNLYETALEIRKRLPHADGPETTYTLLFLGDAYARQGKIKQAEAIYNKALQRSKRVGADPKEEASALFYLASLALTKKDFAEGERLGLSSVKGFGQHTLPAYTVMVVMASKFRMAGYPKKAVEYFKRAAEVLPSQNRQKSITAYTVSVRATKTKKSEAAELENSIVQSVDSKLHHNSVR